MFSSILSAAISGVTCVPVRVEADVSNGLPLFSMVGYLSSRVKEAQDRVCTALRNSGFSLPAKRITVNLSPADIRKEGTGFDLPIAAALLCSFGFLDKEQVSGVCMAGELSLNGEVKGIQGILPIVDAAIKSGCKLCVIPKENLKETEFFDTIPILGVENLKEILLCAGKPGWGAKKNPPKVWEMQEEEPEEDFSDILGQEAAKRAAVIAAAGFHNLLFIGARGAGKTMIASRIPGIFPGLSREEGLEISGIYSAAGLLSKEDPILHKRPFRQPHHTISPKAMAGGGRIPQPGELTLAHRGVLFLDELPEFSRAALEVLRQPLEAHKICISRINGTYEFPADFLLVAAMNPCPCGYYPDRNRCSCTDGEVSRYLGRISGPLLDRFDLCTEVKDVSADQLWSRKKGETSLELRKEILRVHNIQKERYRNCRISFNGSLGGKDVETYCQTDWEGERLLKKAYEKMKLSMRGYHKILKTARTIADLDREEKIQEKHVAEALFYRNLDEKYRK